MNNIIQKFYSNGKDGSQNYSKLGAFSSSMITNLNPISSITYKSIEDFKPKTNVINLSTYTNNYKTLTPQRYTKVPNDEYLKPKQLVFNSSSDMLFYNPFKFNQKGELSLLKENALYENRKNATKMQMIEEKMKNLELKNQRLEVINNFFFDMLEKNNLSKNEFNRKGDEFEEIKNINDDESEYSSSESNYFRKRKKHKKIHKSRSDIDLNKNDYKNKFDALNFQQKTAQNARNILDNIKKNLGTYLVEEELKKNERFQSINEGINELKSDLIHKLDKIQKKQNQQMQKIAYCLLHSGDDKVEGLAMSLFNNDFPNFNYFENIYNNEKNLYKSKGENDEYNELINKRNSGQNSFRNYFRSTMSSKRNSLKRNQSQIEMIRNPNIRFREDY